jgi:phosphatidylserine decarboxylase
LSSDEEDEDEDVYTSGPSTPAAIDVAHPQPIMPLPTMVVTEALPVSSTVLPVAKIPTASKPPSPSFNLARIFPTKRTTLTPSTSDSSTTTSPPSGASTPSQSATSITRPSSAAGKLSKKAKFRKSWGPQKKQDFDLNAGNDVLGIVMVEIQGATDLPKLKNSGS